jgi:vitamin B12 transporter
MKGYCVKTSLIIGAALIAVAAPVHAQDSSAIDETEDLGDPIIIDEGRAFMDGTSLITVTAAPLGTAQANAAITFIGEHDLERAQNGAVADLLARTPGVTLTRNGAPGSFTGLRIRGAEAEQTLVVINGVRVADPSSPGGGFDFGSLMIGGIDTIEVLRGANSLAWGSQAIGGVVAITTLRPSANINDPTQGHVNAEYGAYDTRRASVQLRTYDLPLGTYAFGVGYTDSDGFSSAANGSEPDGFRQYRANFSSYHYVAGGVTIRSFGQYSDSRTDLDGFPAPSYSFADTDEYQTSREAYGGVAIEHVADSLDTESGFSHRLSLGVADVNRDSFDPAFGSAPGFSARGRSERLSYSIDWAPIGDYGGGWNRTDLRILAGVEREWNRSKTGSSFGYDRQSTHTTSGYAMVLGKPSDALSLTAGVRHDDHADFGGATTFGADIGWELGDTLKLTVSVREGFKAPTLFQLSADPFAYGNPDLAPERARSYEIGFARSYDYHWRASVTLFRRDSRNLIDFVSCGSGGPAICASGNRFYGTYDNINRARAQGVEVVAGVNLAEDIDLDASYSFVDSRDQTAGSPLLGNALARRPRHSANVALTWSAGSSPDFGTDVSLALRYGGASYDDRGNGVRLDDYWLVDLRVQYPLGDDLKLFARVENLFDAQYQTVAGYGTAGRSAFAGISWDL